MPESFDQILTRKFRSLFERYDEPFNESAWDLMKQKLQNKKKRRFFLLIDIAKAASVILFISLSILIPFRTNDKKASNNMNIDRKDNSSLTAKNNIIEEGEYTYNDPEVDLNFRRIYVVEDQNVNKTVEMTDTDIISIDSIIKRNDIKNIYAENTFDNVVDTSAFNKNDSTELIDKRPILRPDDSEFFVKKRNEKKFNFGLALSSHYSSSDIGAKDRINIGGGFLTEYIISKRISINSGLLLANHNLNTRNNSLFGGFMKADAIENTYDNGFAGSSETEILLVGLDIPINVKLNFDKMFISTGISSLVYLKERYSENYYVENIQEVYNTATQSYETLYLYDNVNETYNNGAFQTFDFAKLLNISVGYLIPLKKGNLILEPYAKLPLGRLTTYNISYGYGGLSLKYDF